MPSLWDFLLVCLVAVLGLANAAAVVMARESVHKADGMMRQIWSLQSNNAQLRTQNQELRQRAGMRVTTLAPKPVWFPMEG